MKKLYFWLFPFTLFGAINSDGDTQLWQWNFINIELHDQLNLFTTTEVRWGDNVSKLYYGYIQPQIAYSATDWVNVRVGCRFAERRFPLDSVQWITEYTPIADVFLHGKVSGWEISDRNRFEYIISEVTDEPWLYRNRLRIYLPYHWTSIELCPFFDDEIFWRQGEGINEDRVSIGLQQTYSHHLGSEVFYMARFQKTALGWIHQNVFNIGLYFNY